jgi:protease YdgD
MTRLLRFIVLLAIAAGTCLPAAALDLQRRRMLTAAEHVPWRAVGRVNIEVRSSARGMCTGTLIAEDLVLTAAHCVVSDLTGLAQPPAGDEMHVARRLAAGHGGRPQHGGTDRGTSPL